MNIYLEQKCFSINIFYYKFVLRVISLIFAISLAACSSTPQSPPLASSEFACKTDLHIEDPLQQLEKTAKQSEFLPVHNNKDAYQWRLALVDQAEKTLDIQTFIWEEDETGGLLIDRILKAANRGVYVRILVDDFLLAGRDSIGALVNRHPNIEMRVFNPLEVRDDRMVFRGLEMAFNMSRLNHRMHNKLFIADNQAGIIGGRNIGNEYFGLGKKLNYRDFDLVVQGPIVPEITDSFNVFWNSPSSFPLEKVVDADVLNKTKSKKVQKEARQKLDKLISDSKALKQVFNTEVQNWNVMLENAKEKKFTGKSRIIYDCPPSIDNPIPGQVSDLLGKLAKSVEKEIFFISPYLVPSEKFRDGLRQLTKRGVRVRILTNSLESSDSAAAVSGYTRYRNELLEMGIELHEMRADAGHTHLFKTQSSTAEFLSLHAKVIIFDRRAVYAGSLNLDPRSIIWNTEIGALIDSPELAEAMIEGFERDLLQDNSWTVRMDKDGAVFWHSTEETISITPARNFGQRAAMFFYSLIPMENQI